MNHQHSIGQWHVTTGSTGRYRAPTIEVCTDANGIKHCIATVTRTSSGAANARLIAAAPELLESLQSLIDEYEPNIKTFATDAPRKAKWIAAMSAIAKATGAEE